MRTKKTIAIVNAYNEIAGPTTVLNTFLKHYNQADQRIILFVPKGKHFEESKSESYDVVFTPTVPIDKALLSIKFFQIAFQSIWAFIRFVYLFKKHEVAILHNNSSNLIVSSLAAKVFGINIIYHIREVWASRNPLSKVLYHYIAKSADKIICISEAVKKNFSSRDHLRYTEKFTIVSDCIDMEPFVAFDKKKNTDPAIITFLGRLSPIKGVDVLLNAYKILVEQNRVPPFTLRIVGDIPKRNKFYLRYLNFLKQIAAGITNSLHYKIEWLGFRNDAADLLIESDILVLPSRIEEGLGLVLIEGLMANNVIISSDLGGQQEVIESVGAGLLFKNESPEDLARNISFALLNRNLMEIETSKGKAVAAELFAAKVYTEKIVAIYKTLSA